jgi:hypothetical protein
MGKNGNFGKKIYLWKTLRAELLLNVCLIIKSTIFWENEKCWNDENVVWLVLCSKYDMKNFSSNFF